MTRTIAISLLVLALIVGCSDKSTSPEPKVVRQLTPAEHELVQSGNSFGLKLYREIVAEEPDTNLFISPLSVAMALGMTYNGARGETQTAMAEVLDLQGMDLTEVNKSYQNLIKLLRGLDDKVAFNLANSIWYRHDFTVDSDFIDLNKTYFDALVEALDFSDPAATGTINAWVNEQTRGKISRIVDEIPDYVVMYLINAVYFKANWSTQFSKESTSAQSFTLPDGSTVQCQMMIRKGPYAVYYGDGFSLVDLPYGDSLYSMTILLPGSQMDLDQLAAELTNENLDRWTSETQVTELMLGLPKFELAYGLTLNDALEALGMGIAFSPGAADFTGINAGGGLFLSKVRHKTYVKVDEEGTEAAAVTSSEMGYESLPPTFWVDHPFIYMIREHHSGTILFIGQVTEPHWSD